MGSGRLHDSSATLPKGYSGTASVAISSLILHTAKHDPQGGHMAAYEGRKQVDCLQIIGSTNTVLKHIIACVWRSYSMTDFRAVSSDVAVRRACRVDCMSTPTSFTPCIAISCSSVEHVLCGMPPPARKFPAGIVSDAGEPGVQTSTAGVFRPAAAAALLPTRGTGGTVVDVPCSRVERARAAASCSSGLSEAETSAKCSHTPSSTACTPI